MIIVVERANVDQAIEILKNMGKTDVYLPRPLPAEVVLQIAPYVVNFRMPPSTWKRLSTSAKRVIGNRYKLESRRGRFARVSVEEMALIISLHRSGLSVRKIATELKIPKSTVHYVLNHCKKLADGPIKIIAE